MFTLTTTHPDGTVTRYGPVMHGPQIIAVVSAVLQIASAGLTRRERERAGLQVARGRKGVPLVHLATGLVFRVEITEDPEDNAPTRHLAVVPAL